jgi:hypothetical protein
MAPVGKNRLRGRGLFKLLIAWLRLPLDDYLRALRACLDGFQGGRIALIATTLVAGWWVYVPVHELAHALGCFTTGGQVSRLDIDAVYGAAFLRNIFPFVSVGSEYAGRLSGFDTGGSDLVYLATDFCPFLLTILIGVPLLQSAAWPGQRPLVACMRLGASLPVAYAPFISVTGDYYEMGSILVSRMAALADPSFDVARWRSDDLVKLTGELWAGTGTLFDAAGLAASFVLGTVLMFGTYGLGVLWAEVVARWGRGREGDAVKVH